MQPSISEERYREFLKTFQLFRDPAGLAESPLMASPLVRQTLQHHADLLPYQALQISFKEILELLAQENENYADLLQGRFWEGKQIEEMLTEDRPLPMSKRTFSNYQRNAIQSFAYLFLQVEESRRRQPTGWQVVSTGNDNVLVNAANEHPEQHKTEPIVLAPQNRTTTVPTLTTMISSRAQSSPRPHWHQWRLPMLLVLVLFTIAVLMGVRSITNNLGSIASSATTDHVLFEDDFETGGRKWNADSDAWSIQADGSGNHFYCVNTDGPYTYAEAGSTTWQDYTFHLDINIVNTAPRGSGNVLWRVNEGGTPFYLIDFFAEEEGGGLALARESPEYSTLDQTLSKLPTGVWTHLRIEVKKAQMQLFVGSDTIPILAATDPQPIQRGGIGFGAGFSQITHADHWEVCFDNIKITQE